MVECLEKQSAFLEQESPGSPSLSKILPLQHFML